MPPGRPTPPHAIFAITVSRVVSSTHVSDTNTTMARCLPSGRVTSPASFVARVRPFTVPLDPVLCATMAPFGSSPLIRSVPVLLVVIRPSSRRRLEADSPFPACRAHSRPAIASGVALKAWPLLVLVLLVGIATHLWTAPVLQERHLQVASLDQL